MQSIENSTSQIKELVQHSRKVLLLSVSTRVEGVSALLALAESIRNFGRDVTIIDPAGLESEALNLPGAQDIRHQLDPRSFVISLDYEPGSIEKVSYNTEGNKFNLIVTPSNGQGLSSKNVNYSYTGSEYDLIITCGVADLSVLGEVYEMGKDSWVNIALINIDNHPENSQFGKINALDHQVKTLGEVVARVLLGAKLPVNPLVGELLLQSLRSGTNDFTDINPSVFELAAQISRKMHPEKQESSEEKLVNEPFRKGKKEDLRA